MRVALLGAVALSTLVSGAVAQPRAAGGTATYWMSAETVSGMAAMNQGNQGRSGIGAMLGGRSAAGPNYLHNLRLELGSGRRPTGTPMAEHLPPQALNAGPSLPLVTPESRPMPVTNPANLGTGGGGASGRMLIYWGCGEQAGPGQPTVLDFSKLAAGQVPPGMASLAAMGRAANPPQPGQSARTRLVMR